mmetsp:Transcript_34074/g.76734  ORF Transcript_34074/g.76734 Transcript_34074/m.76734 type:complete len:258 (-) Transcript_34074:129-902(-)
MLHFASLDSALHPERLRHARGQKDLPGDVMQRLPDELGRTAAGREYVHVVVHRQAAASQDPQYFRRPDRHHQDAGERPTVRREHVDRHGADPAEDPDVAPNQAVVARPRLVEVDPPQRVTHQRHDDVYAGQDDVVGQQPAVVHERVRDGQEHDGRYPQRVERQHERGHERYVCEEEDVTGPNRPNRHEGYEERGNLPPVRSVEVVDRQTSTLVCGLGVRFLGMAFPLGLFLAQLSRGLHQRQYQQRYADGHHGVGEE